MHESGFINYKLREVLTRIFTVIKTKQVTYKKLTSLHISPTNTLIYLRKLKIFHTLSHLRIKLFSEK